ncbi:MAG: oligosaccharide flippase family protein [Candidatus Omnitrophica bacterium]|nr:oligosaccharide flippase family protein [Candidatus Omnitrophota bacterium]MDD5512233.1 oligosaccharide flippase family protein [Candidatus Omnitrophota bacterium]
MLNRLKKIDKFSRNIFIVFTGTSLANLLNLFYQLLIAHSLSAFEFAAFNSLLSVFMLIATPVGTLQLAMAKYTSKFRAAGQTSKITYLFSGLLKKVSVFAILAFLIFTFSSRGIINALKIDSLASGYILAGTVGVVCLVPLFLGGVQGLELFGWYSSSQAAGGILKLASVAVFLYLGYGIAGSLGALLISAAVSLIILYLPLKKYISFALPREDVDYRGVLIYLFPVAAANFCFINLVSFDMVWVKYFFAPQDSGAYALAQMLGKIFLFLPGAISIVMFPRTSGLSAGNQETLSTLSKSLKYVVLLSGAAMIFYNLFPVFVLKILTGKSFPEAVFLGRLFSVSMSLYALLFIMISYFLSVKDLRFLGYLAGFLLLQNALVVIFHPSLVAVQLILCFCGASLLLIHLFLAYKKR